MQVAYVRLIQNQQYVNPIAAAAMSRIVQKLDRSRQASQPFSQLPLRKRCNPDLHASTLLKLAFLPLGAKGLICRSSGLKSLR
ncbi:hypothetical protein D3C71_1650990 [compost metagenome]